MKRVLLIGAMVLSPVVVSADCLTCQTAVDAASWAADLVPGTDNSYVIGSAAAAPTELFLTDGTTDWSFDVSSNSLVVRDETNAVDALTLSASSGDAVFSGDAVIPNVRAGADVPGSDIAPVSLYSYSDVSSAVQLIIEQATNDLNGPLFYFYKTRATDKTANTIVQNNDILGQVIFWGADGTSFKQAANIKVTVNGTPGSSDMPGKMSFLVSPDGSATPAVALDIDQSKVSKFYGKVIPNGDNSLDLGASSNSWRNLYVDGVAAIATVSATSALIAPSGTSLPGTCSTGSQFLDTDSDDCADTGSGDGALCFCKTSNTWVLVKDL